jgi:hypothetical protein
MSAGTIARRVALGGCIAVLAGCATRPAPMYLWESFPRQQYETLLRNGASPDEQLRVLQAHAEKARAAGAALPPGFRAHLGMVHLAAGDAAQARDAWNAEKAAFPESAAYMNQLLKRLDAPATTAKNANPA